MEAAAVHVDKARIALRKAVSLKKSSNRVRSALCHCVGAYKIG